MVSAREVNKQLKNSGYYYRFWMRKEIRELSKVLDEGETIKQCVNGYYQGGLALLAATDRRLLLIDCKPMYLTLEVIWYDKIGQIDYNHRLVNATIIVSTPNKELSFTSYNTQHLRQALVYTQVKIAEAESAKNGEKATPSNISFRGQSRVEAVEPTTFGNAISYQEPAGTVDIPQSQIQQQYLSGPAPTFSSPSTRLPFSRRRYFANTSQESETIV